MFQWWVIHTRVKSVTVSPMLFLFLIFSFLLFYVIKLKFIFFPWSLLFWLQNVLLKNVFQYVKKAIIGAASRGSCHFSLSINRPATRHLCYGLTTSPDDESIFSPAIGWIRSGQRSRIFGALRSGPGWRVFERATEVKKHVFCISTQTNNSGNISLTVSTSRSHTCGGHVGNVRSTSGTCEERSCDESSIYRRLLACCFTVKFICVVATHRAVCLTQWTLPLLFTHKHGEVNKKRKEDSLRSCSKLPGRFYRWVFSWPLFSWRLSYGTKLEGLQGAMSGMILLSCCCLWPLLWHYLNIYYITYYVMLTLPHQNS